MPEQASPPGKNRKWPALLEYGLAILLVVLATGFRFLLEPYMGLTVPYVTYFLCNALVIRFTGMGPSLFAIFLSTFAAHFFFLPPRYTLWSPPAQYITSLTFFLANLVILTLARAMRNAKERAEANAQRLNAIIETEPECVKVLSSDGRLLEINPAGLAMIEADGPEEVLGQPMDSLIAPEHQKAFRALTESVCRGQPGTLDFEVIGLKGAHRWLETHAVPFHRRPENDTCLLAITRDITRRKQAEARLRDVAEKYSTIFDTTSDGVWINDPQGQLVEVNDAYCRMSGYSREELKQMPISRLEAVETADEVAKHGKNILRSGGHDRFESRHRRKDGSTFDVEVVVLYLEREGGRFAAFVRDITARKQAEAAVQQSNEQIANILSSISDSFFSLDEQLRVTYFNAAAERLLQRPREEVLGRPLFDAFPEAKGSIFETNYTQALREKKSMSFETYFEREPYRNWYDVRVYPQANGISVYFQVITERKQAQAVLERLVAERTAKLQELVGELEHYSYTITHDMRAPLRAMRGFAEMINLYCPQCPKPETKDFLRRISASADRMDNLITDALNYNRAVRQELALSPIDVGALLRGMVDSYPELQPSKAQIQIEAEMPLVMGNEAGLTQCFSNLLGNAVKFVKPGQKPEIRIWAERRDGWVRVWIEDKGVGIPDSIQGRIFDMFSRGHQDYQGTGIGLALVRKVMERMDGKVGVESEEGQGSRFWLDLKPGDVRERR